MALGDFAAGEAAALAAGDAEAAGAGDADFFSFAQPETGAHTARAATHAALMNLVLVFIG